MRGACGRSAVASGRRGRTRRRATGSVGEPDREPRAGPAVPVSPGRQRSLGAPSRVPRPPWRRAPMSI